MGRKGKDASSKRCHRHPIHPKKEVLHLRQLYLSVPFFMALLGYFLPKILHKDAFRVRIEGNAHERPCKKTLLYWDKICFKFFVHHLILNICANNVRKHIWSKQKILHKYYLELILIEIKILHPLSNTQTIEDIKEHKKQLWYYIWQYCLKYRLLAGSAAFGVSVGIGLNEGEREKVFSCHAALDFSL